MAINVAVIQGRLTRDPEIRTTGSGVSVAKFSVAVDRVKDKDGERRADFIPCTAFGKTAEMVERWFRKGDGIGVTGRIQTGSYKNKDEVTVYTTDVIVERIDFPVGGKDKKEEGGESQMRIPEGFEEIDENEIPF